jgi:hypothetical protein
LKTIRLLSLVGVALLITGCSSNGSPVAGPSSLQTSTTPSTSPSASASAIAPLVGRWERVVTCEELVAALRDAGFGPLAKYAWVGQTSSTGVSSFTPGSPKPTQAHPCAGAVPREHSHFFNPLGQFGSLDWLGGQVDDDSYRIINDNTLQIGETTFHYRIDGNALTLSPVLTKAMLRQALAHPKEFNAAGRAVSVAYPGRTWMRVPCEGWC